MTHLGAFSKVTSSTALTLALMSACGGNSFSGGDPQGGSSSGGSSAGGSTSNAGKHQGGSASGGTHSGGSSAAGTSSGGSATAGAGGSGPGGEACNAQPASGNCNAYFERWFHDSYTGLCRSFIYGGCGGNENNYETFAECQKACPGGSPNYDACNAPTDCVVAGTGCCGICDSPDITARDLIAYNHAYASQIAFCGGGLTDAPGAAPPEDIACAPCAPVADDTGALKYFVPNCVQGQCVVEDVRTSVVSACKLDEDCRIRNGNSCCSTCGEKRSIAVSNDGGFEQLVCGDKPPPCPACEPEPTNEVAVCGEAGHCEVQAQIPL